MPLSIPVPPLHEPRTPPPVLPILATHTSITLFPTETKKLATHETLPFIMPIAPPGQALPVTTPSQMTSVAPPSQMPSVAPPSQMPSVMKLPTVRFCTLTPDNASEDLDLTTLPSEAGSDSSLEDGHIPKPPGEAGRPSWMLSAVVDWLVNDYKKLKRCVYQGIQKHLDYTKSFSYQNSAAVEWVQQQVLAECPFLNWYINYWPFTDMLMGMLKSSSAKWRREQQIKCEGEKRWKTSEKKSK